jgi:hypothetical protein
MRPFLLRVGAFAAMLGLLLGGLEYLQRRLPNNYSHKRALLEARLPEIETLVLGNSHTYLGLNPDSLPGPAFNLASTAQTLQQDAWLLETYLPHMPRLRRVILPLTYASLGSESQLMPDDYDKRYHFFHFFGCDSAVSPASPRYYSVVNLFTVRESVNRTWAYYMQGDSLVEFRRNGWYATEEQRDLARNGRESGIFQDRYYAESQVPANIERLLRIARGCQARGIRLYLVSTPMWASFLAHTRPERQTRMRSVADSLSRAEGFPWWDHTEDPRFGAADFFDSNHLRSQGANAYTRLIAKQIAAYEEAATGNALP